MPKKIKKKEKVKFRKVDDEESIERVQKVIITICIIGLLVMLSVGMFVLIRDSGYKHSSNKVVSFSYSEGYSDKGYDVYELNVEDNGIYVVHNLGEESENISDKWSRTKYLNFNEELYESGVLDFESDEKEKISSSDFVYRVDIEFENGEEFTSYGMGEVPQNTGKFKELINKYFDSNIDI